MTDTVTRRVNEALIEISPAHLAAGVGLLALAGTLLLFSQDPLVHETMHNFRHGAGVTCH